MAFRFNQGDRPLSGYTIQRGVGRGGFGEVYYATSDGGKEVALKYLRDNPQVELRGVMHCLNLKSPYLVAIHDVRESAEGEFFVVMEYVNGPSLRDLMNNEAGGLGPQKAAYFLREIGKGLAYLHDRGIVHRDLKPGNIFYEDGYVKIGDYGLAKIMAASQHSGQTMSVGTVHYMAPEVGSGNYDRTIDIYALGVMLYEMLLGKVPFSGATMGEVLMKHLTAQPAVDELPAPFPQVIRKALAKDPNDRYQTVQEMISSLFDVADLERSVAAFEPASLSALAARAANSLNANTVAAPARAGAAVLGSGSSNVGGMGPPPVINPAVMPFEIGGRFGRINDRVQQKLDRLANRIDGSPFVTKITDAIGGGEEKKGKVFIGAIVRDSNGNRYRRAEIIMGALVTAALTSIAIGFVSSGRLPPATAAASSFLLMAAIVSGTIGAAWMAYEKLRTDSEWTPRLMTAGFMSIFAIPAVQVAVAKTAPHHAADWHGALVVVAILCHWMSRFNDGRRGQSSFGRAVKAGILALIVSSIFTLNDPLFCLSVMMGSLLVQMVAKAWPAPALDADGQAEGAQQFSPPSPAGVAVSRGDAGPMQSPQPPEYSPAAFTNRRPQAPIRDLRSGSARILWWIATGLVLCATSICGAGIGLLEVDQSGQNLLILATIFGGCSWLFCMSCAFPRYHKGMWRGVFRKAVFFGGLALSGIAGASAGLYQMNNRGLFLTISACIVGGFMALLVWLIPSPQYVPIAARVAGATPARRTDGWLVLFGLILATGIISALLLPAQVGTSSSGGVATHTSFGPVFIVIAAITLFALVMLVSIGCVRMLKGRSQESQQATTLPIRRVFILPSTTNLSMQLERHFAAMGYKLKERGNLLWTFQRGSWHSQFWDNDVRRWAVRLNIAAYALDTGDYRLTCYLNLDRGHRNPGPAQLAVLNQDISDLQDVLSAREIMSAV